MSTVTEAKVARAYLAEAFLAGLGPGHQAEVRLQLDVLQLRRADGVRLLDRSRAVHLCSVSIYS